MAPRFTLTEVFEPDSVLSMGQIEQTVGANCYLTQTIAQSAGDAEYTNCISAEG